MNLIRRFASAFAAVAALAGPAHATMCMQNYTPWSACLPNGTQFSELVSTTPAGCTIGMGPGMGMNVGQMMSQMCAYRGPMDPNHTALWWDPTQPGWGVHIAHQDSILFATLFVYGDDGAARWYVASSMTLVAPDRYEGTLYQVTGPGMQSMWFPPTATAVGTISIAFAGDGTATVSYTIGTTTVTRTVRQQAFGAMMPRCVETPESLRSSGNYQDLWWNSMEPGWGMNIAHQGDLIFATLFLHDDQGRAMWLVASSMPRQGDGSYAGALYQTNGPRMGSASWGAVGVTEVGTMTLRFTDGEHGTLTYSYNGAVITKEIERQEFGNARPFCW